MYFSKPSDVFIRNAVLTRPKGCSVYLTNRYYDVLETFTKQDIKNMGLFLNDIVKDKKRKNDFAVRLLYVIRAYVNDFYNEENDEEEDNFFYKN